VPAVVSVVEVIKNAEVDLRLGITADGRIVVVIRELVQCALLMSERGAQRFLSDPANQDLAQTIGMVALETARWHGAKSDQVTCDVKHVETVFDWAVEGHGGINVILQEQKTSLWRPCTRRRAISQQHASRAREMRWPTPSASKSLGSMQR